MSDDPLKKPGVRLAKKPMLDQLQAELSADLKTGEDALFYDWTRVADAPPSEAAYVPPMQIQTLGMNTRELAAVIGQEAAEAARHAPSPGQSVVIDERDGRSEGALEVETFGDSIPTVEMPGGPISDDRDAVTRRLSAVGQRGRSGWVWVAVAIAAVLGVAFVWTQRVPDSGVTSEHASPKDVAFATSATRAATPAPSLPTSTVPTTLTVAEPTDDAIKSPPPVVTALPKVAPPVLQQLEHLPPRRSPATGSTPRTRVPSTPQTAPTKPTSNEDPLLVENPGY